MSMAIPQAVHEIHPLGRRAQCAFVHTDLVGVGPPRRSRSGGARLEGAMRLTARRVRPSQE
jgi:hypothetical protein